MEYLWLWLSYLFFFFFPCFSVWGVFDSLFYLYKKQSRDCAFTVQRSSPWYLWPASPEYSPIQNFKATLCPFPLHSWIYQEDLQSINSKHLSENPFPQTRETLLAVATLACSSTGIRNHGETHLGRPPFRVVLVLPDSLSIRVGLKNHIRLSGFCSPPSSAHILPSSAYTWIMFLIFFFLEVYSSTSYH